MSVKVRLEASAVGGNVPHTRLSAVGPGHGGVAGAFLPGDQTNLYPTPEFDAVLLMQPTSPLRVVDDIDGIIRLAEQTGAGCVVSVAQPSQQRCCECRRRCQNRDGHRVGVR